MESEQAITVLAALAQETRLKIFRMLVTAGPEGLCAGVIAEKLGLAPATLSFHLAQLARAGLVSSQQQSRFVFYCADFAAIDALIAFLTQDCCGGRACLPSVAGKGSARARRRITTTA